MLFLDRRGRRSLQVGASRARFSQGKSNIGEKKGQGSPFLAGANAPSAYNLTNLFCFTSEQRTAPYIKNKQPSARESCLAAHERSAVLMRRKFLRGCGGTSFKKFPHKTSTKRPLIPLFFANLLFPCRVELKEFRSFRIPLCICL